MQTLAYSIAQSHIEDLRRAAAASALRGDARRDAAEGLSPRRISHGFVLRATIVRRMVARLAV